MSNHPSLTTPQKPKTLQETMNELEAFSLTLQEKSLQVTEEAVQIGKAFQQVDALKILGEMETGQQDFITRYSAVLDKLEANATLENEILTALKSKLSRV